MTQVSELGQLQQATTGNDVTNHNGPIAMDAIDTITNRNGRDWCYHGDVPNHSQSEPLERNNEGRTRRPHQQTRQGCQVTWRNSSRNVDNRHRCVNRREVSTKNVTMKLGDPRTGSLGQIRLIHASDLPWRERRGQQQNLQKKNCK